MPPPPMPIPMPPGPPVPCCGGSASRCCCWLLLLLLSRGCRGPSLTRARAELPRYPLTISSVGSLARFGGRAVQDARLRNDSSCAFETAPTCCAATVPSRNSSRVGMPRMLYFGGVFGFSSMLSLTTRSSIFVLVGDHIEYRCDHLAGPAPFGPEIEKNGLRRLHDVRVEGRIGRVYDLIIHG